MASPQPGIPPTLLEVCMRLPHFFQRLMYVELDRVGRTSLALTSHSFYDTLVEMHRALPKKITGGGPVLISGSNLDPHRKPRKFRAFRDFLEALERDLMRNVIDDNRSPRMVFCTYCWKLHDPEIPINQIKSGLERSRRLACAGSKVPLPSLGNLGIEGASFPPAFHPLKMYYNYRYKLLTNSWEPTESEREEYDVELKPGDQWFNCQDGSETPSIGKKEFQPPVGIFTKSVFSSVRYMAKTSPDGVFIGMTKTHEGEIPGPQHAGVHRERPCQHVDIWFRKNESLLEIFHDLRCLEDAPKDVASKGYWNSKLGKIKFYSTSKEDIWDRLFTCRQCNREWMLESGPATAESEAYLRVKIWACTGWKNEVVDCKDLVFEPGRSSAEKIRVIPSHCARTARGCARMAPRRCSTPRYSMLPLGACMAPFEDFLPTTRRD